MGPGPRPHFWIPAWFTHSLDPSRCLNFGANAFYHEMSKGGYRSDPVILWGLHPIFAEQIDRYCPVGPCSDFSEPSSLHTHIHTGQSYIVIVGRGNSLRGILMTLTLSSRASLTKIRFQHFAEWDVLKWLPQPPYTTTQTHRS